ncbi:unnamed protein product [Durusdinium trenchii]|uniref:PDZ domain-containing protein n=1 Tax=Durusdinium trenchii TaxID=1381693 RepID=A0ABP0R4A8_9DINO
MTGAAVVAVGRPVIVSPETQVVKLGESPKGVDLGDVPSAVEVQGKAAPPEQPVAAKPEVPAVQPIAEATARSASFTCSVDKNGQPLGIRVEYVRDKCIVLAVTSGLIPAWNNANPDKAVRPGDCISQVNGEAVSGAQAADKLAQSAGKVELLLERPQELRIPIQVGEVLGIKVSELLEGFGVEVTEVKQDGQIPSFNKDKQLAVRPSDRIVAVNGKQASSSELFEMVAASSCQELLVYTYS